jgi:hypothetical protein
MIEQASLVLGNGNWAVKSDSLLGYKINGGKYYPREMSVVRATTGTRINEDGLVEVVPYNLLQYSEDLNNATWASGEVTLASGQSSPLGTNTAFKITGTSAVNAYLYDSVSVTSGNTYTASVYLKGATSGSVSLRVDSGTTAPNNPVSYTTEWQRFTYTFTAGSTTAIVVLGGYNTWTGSEEIFVYGFQLVEGTEPLDYLPTTDRLDIARIDYSSGSGALLLEPQRTNILTYSSSFDNAAWAKVPLGGTALTTVVTANDTISPSGIQDADKIFMSLGGGTTTSDWARLQSQTFNQTSGTSYTISFWAWASQSSEVGKIVRVGIGGNTALLDFTLTATATRFTVTYTAAATGTDSLLFQLRGAQGLASTAEFYLWGAQLELGSYSTSLIPTQAATVTRNADLISKTGATDLIGQTEGTIYFEGEIKLGESSRLLFVSDGTFTNFINTLVSASGEISAVIRFATINSTEFTSSALTAGVHKIAFAYKANDSALYIDGVSISGTSGADVPATSRLDIGSRLGSDSFLNSEINAAALYKTRLTNAELATLTTI